MKKRIILSALVLFSLSLFTSCSMKEKDANLLDPQAPITISVWNYYNGSVKDKFDGLVKEFNETVGMEQGIVVEAQSYGDVNDLADAVYESAEKEIGSLPMPNVFAAYPDNAFRINQVSELVTLSDYFSEEELSEIKEEFLTEGMFGENQELKILPIAKSTEILYVNKNYWDTFAKETGATSDNLATWEGLVSTAKLYYEHTGKAFFSIDSNANYMIISAMQLGDGLYHYNGNKESLNLSQDVAYRIWQNYYVPYLNGYFAKTGRFSSDDAKTGLIAAYTGSSAGAIYFPVIITDSEENIIPVDVMTLPYPYFEGGKPYVIQQGAGMCIAKSDKAHEYASALFLKWFISASKNLKFAVATAYLPIKNETLNEDIILAELDREKILNPSIRSSIKTTTDMLKTHTLYGSKPFKGSYEVRNILENSLFNRVQKDLNTLNERVTNGENRQDIIDELASKEMFLDWYNELTSVIQDTLE